MSIPYRIALKNDYFNLVPRILSYRPFWISFFNGAITKLRRADLESESLRI